MGALSCLLLASLFSSSLADIIELDDRRFADDVAEGRNPDLWFVKFYQPWCGYCNKMQPAWEQADADVHSGPEAGDQAVPIHFAQLDCGQSSRTCDRLAIPGYPKLTLFVNGTMYDFPKDQDRTADNFARFVQGGYRDGSPRPIPSGTSWIESVRKEVENVWHNSKFIFFRYPEVASCFMALGTFVGIATTSLAFMMTMTTPDPVKDKRE